MSTISRHTSATYDPDAQELNRQMNIVRYRIENGHALRKVLIDKFGGNKEQFRRWAKAHLDTSETSLARYLILAANEDKLKASGLVSLIDAYRWLNLDKDSIFKIE